MLLHFGTLSKIKEERKGEFPKETRVAGGNGPEKSLIKLWKTVEMCWAILEKTSRRNGPSNQFWWTGL